MFSSNTNNINYSHSSSGYSWYVGILFLLVFKLRIVVSIISMRLMTIITLGPFQVGSYRYGSLIEGLYTL